MSRVLLPSLDSSMWHWRQNYAVDGAWAPEKVLSFGLYGPLTKK
jgi:hypothetical protein